MVFQAKSTHPKAKQKKSEEEEEGKKVRFFQLLKNLQNSSEGKIKQIIPQVEKIP